MLLGKGKVVIFQIFCYSLKALTAFFFGSFVVNLSVVCSFTVLLTLFFWGGGGFPGGGSKIFSMEGWIFKKFSKVLSTFFFFSSTKLIFRALPRYKKKPCFGQILCAAGKFLKKKALLGTF